MSKAKEKKKRNNLFDAFDWCICVMSVIVGIYGIFARESAKLFADFIIGIIVLFIAQTVNGKIKETLSGWRVNSLEKKINELETELREMKQQPQNVQKKE